MIFSVCKLRQSNQEFRTLFYNKKLKFCHSHNPSKKILNCFRNTVPNLCLAEFCLFYAEY